MILEQFYPREWLNSTYEIPWEEWQKKGIRGAIFDIDNTLVEHDAPQVKGRWSCLNGFADWA